MHRDCSSYIYFGCESNIGSHIYIYFCCYSNFGSSNYRNVVVQILRSKTLIGEILIFRLMLFTAVLMCFLSSGTVRAIKSAARALVATPGVSNPLKKSSDDRQTLSEHDFSHVPYNQRLLRLGLSQNPEIAPL